MASGSDADTPSNNNGANVLKSQNNEGSDEDDDSPQLAAHTLAALQEFYAEQEALRELLERSHISAQDNNSNTNGNQDSEDCAKNELFEKDLTKTFPEDWQLSQFWYDEKTSKTLADKVLELAGNGKVACVSCPSIFRACGNAPNVHLFEYDKRFKAFGSLFHFYDYNNPEDIPEDCLAAFSVVVADPPFLAEECMEKVSLTVAKLLQAKGHIIFCTGAVMEPTMERLLKLRRSPFVPYHKNNLGNEFACFTNFDLNILNDDK